VLEHVVHDRAEQLLAPALAAQRRAALQLHRGGHAISRVMHGRAR
jgi:hypothetical protein